MRKLILPVLSLLLMNLWIEPLKAEIDTDALIGEWCLTQRSMTGYESEESLPLADRENLKTEVGRSYRFFGASVCPAMQEFGSVQFRAASLLFS